MRKVRVTIFYENHIAHRTLKEADPMTLVNPRLGPPRSIMLEKKPHSRGREPESY